MRMSSHTFFSHTVPDRRKRKARQKVKKTVTFFLLCFGIPAVFIYVAFFFFFSRFFSIERIQVLSDGDIKSEDVRGILFKKMDERRFFFAKNENIFLFDTDSAIETLKTFFAVDMVVLKRQFPRTLLVKISGKPFAALWCTMGACYTLYTDGKISQQIDPVAMGIDVSKLPESFHSTTTPSAERVKKQKIRSLEIPLFVDEKNDPLPEDHSSLISPMALEVLRTIVRQLSEKGISVAYIKTHHQSADTTVVTQEGWDILFTPFEDAGAQIENLQTVLDMKIKKDRKKLKYIDVRFQNHIYYTFR